MEKREGTPGKILVVDDNQDSRELVLKILKGKGHQLIEADDGEDALEKVAEEQIEILQHVRDQRNNESV